MRSGIRATLSVFTSLGVSWSGSRRRTSQSMIDSALHSKVAGLLGGSSVDGVWVGTCTPCVQGVTRCSRIALSQCSQCGLIMDHQ